MNAEHSLSTIILQSSKKNTKMEALKTFGFCSHFILTGHFWDDDGGIILHLWREDFQMKGELTDN
jgi:hypothetical protein